VDADSGLVHGQEEAVFGDAGYQGIDKRADVKAGVLWHVAMKPGQRRGLAKNTARLTMLFALSNL
jgi:IS5 family transposase